MYFLYISALLTVVVAAVVRDRVSQWNSHGCPGIHSVDQSSLKQMHICVPLVF